MSFDLRLVLPACDKCGRPESDMWEGADVTHNLNGIVDLILVHGGATRGRGEKTYRERAWGRLDGWKAYEIAPIATKAWLHLIDSDNAPAIEKLKPTNGWGTIEGLKAIFERLAKALEAYPQATFYADG